ncbi:AAA family ATPase [Bacillus atrophaeus]|uniref:ParA family protein n=1 Tax=Bacillus subtilis group TaxID=653685 RepID=UPI0022800D57|nr:MULTISPECIES: AAA family ATPase [Bacillus subtilis group]MCY8914284.1 AAA family ATPase [Bacillus atrophaeus]MCY9114638.1 AAA family ATPase [Bacillus atrophaeus]MDF4197721.1 AAA family ATPase [Bacillus subtilis]MDF4215450.1 AAA family ATPase [Bacillus subtilis]MEC0924134.1 AAA family ATPase [Bacillus atrophaeus]
MSREGKVISFINMKGGVGKTTLCIGIGEFLANYRNKKILFIDVDPQFNTTQTLLDIFNLEEEYMDTYRENKSIRKLFQTTTSITDKPTLPNPEDVILKPENHPNMHLICGNIDLIFDDNHGDGAKARRIKKFINENNLRREYDFIFIDCPPTISFYTDAALTASDFYIVPNRIDRYSILGIKLLKQVIDRLSFDEELNIKPLGIIYTMVDNENRQKAQKLRETFESTDIVKEIDLFDSFTYQVNDLTVGLQGNISSRYKKSREDIEKVSDDFLNRIEGRYTE